VAVRREPFLCRGDLLEFDPVISLALHRRRNWFPNW